MAKPTGDEEEESGASTALVPKSVLGGKAFKVGDEVVLRIVHEYEDEVEVEYAPEPAKEKQSDESRSADDEIDEMASAGMAASDSNPYA
ncbi:MAG: hypothetical protein ABFD89_03835 [Bryobacteraceae bacterium]